MVIVGLGSPHHYQYTHECSSYTVQVVIEISHFVLKVASDVKHNKHINNSNLKKLPKHNKWKNHLVVLFCHHVLSNLFPHLCVVLIWFDLMQQWVHMWDAS